VALSPSNQSVLLITPRAPLDPGNYRVRLRGIGAAALADVDATVLGTMLISSSPWRTRDESLHHNAAARGLLMMALCLVAFRAHAEPYLAVQQGLKCGVCHVIQPARVAHCLWRSVAQNVMPANKIDAGPADNWTGQIGSFIRAGGDLRFDGQLVQAPHTSSVQEFTLNQARVYLDASVIPDRLMVVVE